MTVHSLRRLASVCCLVVLSVFLLDVYAADKTAVTVTRAEVTLGDIIYAEDFQGETTWEIGVQADCESAVEDGALTINVNGRRRLMSFSQWMPLSDFVVSFTVQQLEGNRNALCQIALHSQGNHGKGAVTIAINKDLTAAYRIIDGNIEAICATPIGIGFSEHRRVSVICFENTCRVYLEGIPVLFFSDAESKSGTIGLGCESEDEETASFSFDDIIVRSAVSTQADELEQQQANDGIMDLCDAWPSDLIGVAADEVSACGITVGMPLDSLLSMLEGQSYNTDLSGPLPQYSFGDIAYFLNPWRGESFTL